MHEWIVGIVSGLITGIITGLVTGMVVTKHFRLRDQIKLVSDYANKTADHAREIRIEAKEVLQGKDQGRLEELLRKPLRRDFDIGISDADLQGAIASCNEAVYSIKCALDNNNRRGLLEACGDTSEKLLNLWNAAIEYEKKERAREIKSEKCFKTAFTSFYIILVLVLVLACCIQG